MVLIFFLNNFNAEVRSNGTIIQLLLGNKLFQ